MNSNRQNVTDSEILEVALEACRSEMQEQQESHLAVERAASGWPIPLGTMSESLMDRTVELARQALEMADSRPAGTDAGHPEILREALAACRCIIARQQEIDETLEALDKISPNQDIDEVLAALEAGYRLPPGSMETVQSELRQHVAKALALAGRRVETKSQVTFPRPKSGRRRYP